MSNPAVIELYNASSKKGLFKRFVLEDNIGEAIHLHMDSLRSDMSVEGFLSLSDILRKSIEKLDIFGGHSLTGFDEVFLADHAEYIAVLEKVEVEKIKLSDLKFVEVKHLKKGGVVLRNVRLQDLEEYKYLSGNGELSFAGSIYEYFERGREKYIRALLDICREGKYPNNGRHIVLFNGQNYVRYGHAEAAVLAYLNGIDAEVPVIRFHFPGKKHFLNPGKSRMRYILRKLL